MVNMKIHILTYIYELKRTVVVILISDFSSWFTNDSFRSYLCDFSIYMEKLLSKALYTRPDDGPISSDCRVFQFIISKRV